MLPASRGVEVQKSIVAAVSGGARHPPEPMKDKHLPTLKRRPNSAEIKGARQLLRMRWEIFDFEPDLGLKLGQTKHKLPGTLPTDRQATIPHDSGPISACFHNDPKLLNCEIAQPSKTTRTGLMICRRDWVLFTSS